jgi:hypothetical protein
MAKHFGLSVFDRCCPWSASVVVTYRRGVAVGGAVYPWSSLRLELANDLCGTVPCFLVPGLHFSTHATSANCAANVAVLGLPQLPLATSRYTGGECGGDM